MTKVMMNADPISGIFYDCLNHADDHDACTIISTLSNVLVQACFDADCEPTEYSKGHVRIDMPSVDEKTIYLFDEVFKVIKSAARQHPDHIKLY